MKLVSKSREMYGDGVMKGGSVDCERGGAVRAGDGGVRCDGSPKITTAILLYLASMRGMFHVSYNRLWALRERDVPNETSGPLTS